MVKQVINVGANANDGTGDDLRAAMQKINTNFTELYGTTAEANDLVEDGTPQLGGNLDIQNYIITTNTTNGTISIQPNGSGSVLLKNIRITDNVISSDDSTSITINESLAVTGSANITGALTTPALITNSIQSDDSSLISINDNTRVSGDLTVQGDLRVNTIIIDDSTPLSINNNIMVDGNVTAADTVTATTVAAGAVYTEEVQIVDNNISARRSNDDLVLSGSNSGSVKIGVIRFPITDGTNGQVLQTNGAGQLSWATAGAGSGVIFSADDSTSTSAPSGTLQVKGSSNISTTISGDILTITGPNLSSYITDITINVVADDSNTISINNGGTLLFNGEQGITTSTNLDGSVTITGPNLSSYLTNSTITVVGDDSTGITLNSNETIKIAGSNNITTAVSGDTVTITGSTDINVNSISSTDSSAIQINDSINISGNATIAGTINGSLAFSNLTGKPTTVSGYGITDAVSTSTTAITVVGDDSTGTNFTIGETLKVTGSSGIAAAVSGDTLTISLVAPGSVGTIGDLIVSGQTITGGTNGDISIVPQGVGNINLDADRIRIGDLNSDVIISSNGAADLILKTDVDNPSVAGMGSITIGDGVDGVTTLRTSDEGYVSVGNTTWDIIYTTPAVAARSKHGLSVSMDIDRNYSLADLDRYHANAIGARFNILGTDPDNGNRTSYRTQHIELVSALNGKSLISKGWTTFDPSSKNAGITSIDSGGQIRNHASGPIPLSIQNTFRNSTFGNAYVAETAMISGFTNFSHTSVQNTITVNELNGVQLAFDLASQGGDTVVDNIKAYATTGNYFTNGSATANNYYAFWAGQASEATNNWGIYIESADWENYLGGLTIVDSTIRADRSNENIYLETAGSGKVIINDTLNVGTVELNNISSADSSAIQISDSVNISGTLSVDTIDTNIISSSDSSAITVNDDLNISGSLTVANIVNNTMSTNEISSADSSAIQINDAVNMSGTLTSKTIVTNDLISEDSTAIRVLDGLSISGALEVTQISSSDSSAVAINDNLNVSGTLSVDTIDTNTISSSDNSTIQINDSVQISDNLTMGGLLTLSNKTVAQLLLLTPATGTVAYCTNETGGAQPVFYDGTNWRRMTDLTVIYH